MPGITRGFRKSVEKGYIYLTSNDEQEYTMSNEMTQLLIVLPLDMFDRSPLSRFQLLRLLAMRDSSRVIK